MGDEDGGPREAHDARFPKFYTLKFYFFNLSHQS